jgi:hypothetical protein
MLDIGITAQIPGVFKFILDFLGTTVILSEELEVDDPVSFDVTGLNENMTFTGKVYQPNDKQIIISKDGVNYDCIKFKTAISVAA